MISNTLYINNDSLRYYDAYFIRDTYLDWVGSLGYPMIDGVVYRHEESDRIVFIYKPGPRDILFKRFKRGEK